MQRLLRFVWFATCIAFLFVLFKTYINISEYIIIPDAGLPTLNRQVYFYGALGLFALICLFLLLARRLLIQIPKSAWFFPHKSFWYLAHENKVLHREILGAWIYSLGCGLNTVFLFCLIALRSMNDPDGVKAIMPSYYLVGSLIILFLSLISGPIRLAVKQIELFKEDEVPLELNNN